MATHATTRSSSSVVTLALPYHDRRRVDKATVLVDAHVWAVFGNWHWVVLMDEEGADSYVVCGVAGRCPRSLHREAYLLEHGGIEEGKVVDHKNTVRTDCRLVNLRAATRSENSCNRGKPRKRKGGAAPTSQYKGVWRKKPRVLKSGRLSEERKPWVCEVAVKDKGQKHTSTHATEAEAARKYNEVAVAWMGEFANLNNVAPAASDAPAHAPAQ